MSKLSFIRLLIPTHETALRRLTPKHNIEIRTQHGAAPNKCWNCGRQILQSQSPFCESCNAIQRPHETRDYFKFFDLSFNFDVDQKDLTHRYRRLQSVLHPDKFTNRTEQERRISEEYSSLANKGFDTLRAPLRRALHMLELRGHRITEVNGGNDPEFLTEVMELNEELETADTEEKLRKIERKNRNVLEDVSATISEHFRRGNVTEAKKAVIKMKYYDSLSKRIHNLLREKGIVD